jgi:hypothetical protein
MCTPTLALKSLHSAHTVHLCVPYDSHNKQRLFPQTALTGWSLLWRRDVFPVRYELKFYILFWWSSGFNMFASCDRQKTWGSCSCWTLCRCLMAVVLTMAATLQTVAAVSLYPSRLTVFMLFWRSLPWETQMLHRIVIRQPVDAVSSHGLDSTVATESPEIWRALRFSCLSAIEVNGLYNWRVGSVT